MKNIIGLSLLLGLILSACQPRLDIDQPPEIHYGEDICVECNMIISEPRFAAAYYTTDGEARIFDDIGGMAIHNTEHQEDVARFWVHDFETEQWILADQAYFVMSDHLQTPMGHGVVAFSGQGQAEKLIAEVGGMLMNFSDILTTVGSDETSHSHSDS